MADVGAVGLERGGEGGWEREGEKGWERKREGERGREKGCEREIGNRRKGRVKMEIEGEDGSRGRGLK